MTRYEGMQARAAMTRALVIEILGGRCVRCSTEHRLEVDHVHGRPWLIRKLDAERRARRYLRELLEGVALRVLCRSCNAKTGGGFRYAEPRS